MLERKICESKSEEGCEDKRSALAHESPDGMQSAGTGNDRYVQAVSVASITSVAGVAAVHQGVPSRAMHSRLLDERIARLEKSMVGKSAKVAGIIEERVKRYRKQAGDIDSPRTVRGTNFD